MGCYCLERLGELKNGENIDIRNIPAIIAGDETRRAGIVLAKSMSAKKYRNKYC